MGLAPPSALHRRMSVEDDGFSPKVSKFSLSSDPQRMVLLPSQGTPLPLSHVRVLHSQVLFILLQRTYLCNLRAPCSQYTLVQ